MSKGLPYVPARWNGEILTDPERQLQRLLIGGKSRAQSAKLMGLTREELAKLESSLRRKGIRPGVATVRSSVRSPKKGPRRHTALSMGTRRRIGAHLRSLRTSRGMTQAALSDGAFTAAFVSLVENGRAVPSIDSLVHFASRLGVSLRETLPPDL